MVSGTYALVIKYEKCVFYDSVVNKEFPILLLCPSVCILTINFVCVICFDNYLC